MLHKLMDQKTNIKLTFICRNPPEYSKIYNENDPHLFRLATTHLMKNKEDFDKITLGINNTVCGYGLDSKYIFCIFVL
jgi:hypothetical protein